MRAAAAPAAADVLADGVPLALRHPIVRAGRCMFQKLDVRSRTELPGALS